MASTRPAPPTRMRGKGWVALGGDTNGLQEQQEGGSAVEGMMSIATALILMVALILATAIWIKTRRVGAAFSVLLTTGVVLLVATPSILTTLARAMRDMTGTLLGTEEPSSGGGATRNDPAPTPSSEPSKAPTSEAPSPAPAPESTTNWGEVWMVVGIVAVSLIVLIFAAWLITTLARRSKIKHREYVEEREKVQAEKERKERALKEIAEVWSSTTEKQDSLEAQYLSYQKDLSLIAKYPLMVDPSVPLTRKAIRAMTEARNQRPASAPDDRERVEEYRKAVTSFGLALDAAVLGAKREGLKNFSEKEQKDLRTVQDLLRMAEDRAGNPNERRGAYQRAIRTLQDILGEVPETALLEIEARAQEDGIRLEIMA